MAYYIIALDPKRMGQFQERFKFLDSASWFKQKIELVERLPSISGDDLFFVHLKADNKEVDEMVLELKKSKPDARILYVKEESFKLDLKLHQASPFGGDIYIPFSIKESDLSEFLRNLLPPELNPFGNKLTGEADSGVIEFSNNEELVSLRDHNTSGVIDKVFSEVFPGLASGPRFQSTKNFTKPELPQELGEDMSDKDQELDLNDLVELDVGTKNEAEVPPPPDEGMDLNLEGGDLAISDMRDLPPEDASKANLTSSALNLDDAEEDLGLSEDLGIPENLGDLDLSESEAAAGANENATNINFATSNGGGAEDDDVSDLSIDFGASDGEADLDLSDDAKEKLKEIDAIMDLDASRIINVAEAEAEPNINFGFDASNDADINQPLVSDDVDLGNINFSSDEPTRVASLKDFQEETKRLNKKKEINQDHGQDFKEISGAYSGEMERMQATISNLRADRGELLAKIQKNEEERVFQNRNALTLRAELDEKKIELSIMRKKLNEENAGLKDRIKFLEEKKLIVEEKNRILMTELDKSGQKNKIDVKKVQMRERELEQKLELLKSDSETQIKNRDLKILELKRKLDSMEFDMESISVQEKRSVESRFELEDKLDKAIKTLRSAITVLEDETDKNSGALEALKKNIDM